MDILYSVTKFSMLYGVSYHVNLEVDQQDAQQQNALMQESKTKKEMTDSFLSCLPDDLNCRVVI